MGFVIFMVIGAYLLISYGVMEWAISYAKKNGKSAIRWWLGAALVMFLIPCWDWIPTVVAHKYYCEKESGFWVYKTLEQWKAENQGVVLVPEGYSYDPKWQPNGYTETHRLNHRFNWIVKLHGVSSILQVAKREESLVDTKNGEVLVKFVDFSSGNQRSTGATKFWLVSKGCNDGESYQTRMNKLNGNIRDGLKGDSK